MLYESEEKARGRSLALKYYLTKGQDRKFRSLDTIAWVNILIFLVIVLNQLSRGETGIAALVFLITLLLFIFNTKPGYLILKKIIPLKLCCRLPYRFNGLVFIEGKDYFIIFLGILTGLSYKCRYDRIKSCSYSSPKSDMIMLSRTKWGPMFIQLYNFTEDDRKEIEELFIGDAAVWHSYKATCT